MEKFIYLFVHLGIPSIIVLLVIKNRSRSKIHLIAVSGLSFSILCFLYLWGQWPLVGSYYLRYLLLAGIVVLAIFFIKGLGSSLPFWLNNKKNYFILVPISLLAVFILVKNVELYNGSIHTDDGVILEFPLKNGKFYIASGGTNKLVNNHVRDYPNSQQFALDINKLGEYGGAYKNTFSNQNVDHYIYADTVYCPCNGQIIKSFTTLEDNSTSSMDVGRKNGKETL